jgi:hypothetical protein
MVNKGEGKLTIFKQIYSEKVKYTIIAADHFPHVTYRMTKKSGDVKLVI